MFTLSKWTKRGVILGLIAFAVLLTSAYPKGAVASPISPGLGAGTTLAILAATTITDALPAGTEVRGDVASTGGGAGLTGPACSSMLTGKIYQTDGGRADLCSVTFSSLPTTAQTDWVTAFNGLNEGENAACTSVPTELAGQSLVAGVYCSHGVFTLTGPGPLTLVGSGVWIFQSESTLIAASGAHVVGSDPCNVWWRVPSSATLGTNTSLIGNILASESIHLNTGASLTGRALAHTADVTLAGNSVNTSMCAGVLPTVPPPPAPREVPEGDTLLLFGGGMAGLSTWLGWQRRKARSRSK